MASQLGQVPPGARGVTDRRHGAAVSQRCHTVTELTGAGSAGDRCPAEKRRHGQPQQRAGATASHSSQHNDGTPTVAVRRNVHAVVLLRDDSYWP